MRRYIQVGATQPTNRNDSIGLRGNVDYAGYANVGRGQGYFYFISSPIATNFDEPIDNGDHSSSSERRNSISFRSTVTETRPALLNVRDYRRL